MSIIETGFKAANIIIGVDTHKSTHVAVAINEQGARLAAISVPANSKGYTELISWSRSMGSVQAFGIEGTGSYGAGLSRYLLSLGLNVIEVTRPNRQLRYQHGKNDSLDAEGAARSVLSGQAIAAPKTERLPAGAGRIGDVFVEVLKYNVLGNGTVSGRKIPAPPKPLPPVALADRGKLPLHLE